MTDSEFKQLRNLLLKLWYTLDKEGATESERLAWQAANIVDVHVSLMQIKRSK